MNLTTDETLGIQSTNGRRPISPVEFIIYFFLQSTLCTVGIILNIINVSIFSKSRFNATTYVYMTVISVADIVTLTVNFIPALSRCNKEVLGEACNNYYLREFRHNLAYLFPMEHFLSSYSETISCWVTVVVAAERYITMRWHTSIAKTYCNLKSGRIQVLILALVAFPLNLPTLFSMSVRRDNESGRIKVTKTELFNTTFYNNYSWSRFIVVQVIPLIMLCFVNFFLLKLMWEKTRATRSTQRNKFMSVSNSNSGKLTYIKKDFNCFALRSLEYQDLMLIGNNCRENDTPLNNTNKCCMNQVLHQAKSIADRQKERRQKAHNKLTILLITVIILFLTGQIPSALAYEHIGRKLFPGKWYATYKCFAQTFHLFTLSCTFFLYVSLNKHFRYALCGNHC